MKSAFYFILKALFVLKIFKFFVTTFWSCRKNGLQTIAIHIFPTISQGNGDQRMKLGQLIEYNNRNNFLQKSCGK